jgi:hypothetical protein
MFLGVWSMAEPWIAVAGWTLLVAALWLKPPLASRMVLLVLAAIQALAIGQFIPNIWLGRLVEATAFVAYAVAMTVNWRRFRALTPATASV